MSRTWLRVGAVAAGCLLVGLGLAWLLFVEWLHAPPSHTAEALGYLVKSGVASLAAGAIALLLATRFVSKMSVKIGIAFVCASAAAIANVLYLPLLMFSELSDRNILVITSLYFAAISMAFAFGIGALTSRQLRAVHAGALELGAGNFDARVEVFGSDEAADVARAFNRMSAELGQSFERQRRLEHERRDLIAAVSHDLRTPLASIRAMAEAINDGVVDRPDAVRRYTNLIQQESVHLGQLIEDLFELSRIESGNLELRLTSVPIPELVLETVDGLHIQAKEKGVGLEALCAEDLPPLTLDGPRIQRVLVNLIQNAVRHTPSGGRVQVEVTKLNGHVQLAVMDSGEGIALEDQPFIFDQFYRGEKSRSRGSGGAGLGLAISRAIVEAHRGSIQVESRPGKGARFVVTL
jgi:signal transduction histidine kinase